MPVSFELNDVPNRETQKAVEMVILECIGQMPEEEHWKVSIRAGSGYWDVTVEGPQPTRHQTFFDDFRVLPQNIRSWLALYPFR